MNDTRQNRRSFSKRTVSKVMMISAASALVLAAVATQLSAFDYGANLNSRSSIDAPVDFENANPVFRNTLSGFVRRNPVTTNQASGRFLLETSVTNTLSRNADGDWVSDYLVDIDTLRIDGIFPDWRDPEDLVRISLGRFPFAESSGLVFSDRIDGASMSFDFPDYGLVFAGGFTGLIPGGAGGVLMTTDDVLDATDPEIWGASKRVFTVAQATVPEAFARQAVSAGVLAQWDLRTGYPIDADEKLNSQYIFASLGGPAVGDLYYDTALAVSFQQRSFADQFAVNGLSDPEYGVGLAASLQGQYYIDPAGGSIITAMARYGSGDGDTLAAYTPMTGPPVSLLNPVGGADDLSFFMLDYSLRPFAGRPGAQGRTLEVSAYSAVNALANPFADGSYQGVEAGSRLTWRPFSDLGGRLWFGAFVPQTPEDTRLYGRVELSASF